MIDGFGTELGGTALLYIFIREIAIPIWRKYLSQIIMPNRIPDNPGHNSGHNNEIKEMATLVEAFKNCKEERAKDIDEIKGSIRNIYKRINTMAIQLGKLLGLRDT